MAALAWVTALVASAAALAALGYQARDADSRLYGEIAARMSAAPLAEWIAPSFPPGWYMRGPFREHPVGIHLLPALLARAGYPAAQAALAVNGLYVVLALVLLQRLASRVAGEADSRALLLFMQLLPIAFTFRVRANHEAGLLLCMVVALYGLERARTRPVWGALAVPGLVALLLVKGVLVVMGFLACALWLLARGTRARDGAGFHWAWAWLVVAAAAVAAVAAAYELLYQRATGQPFWSFYLGRQMGVASLDQSAAGALQKLYNLVWYLGRVLWFPFPWSLTLAAACFRGRQAPPPDAAATSGTRTAGVFVLLFSALYLATFSLSDRRADRYIFPVYYAVGAAGAIAALRAWPRLAAFMSRVDQGRPWAPAALWLVLFALHILAGWLGLPTIKVWAPDT
jgi:4-amino-4-deoxy-L-arabinose transferase-like glycosyltransferase